MLKKTDGEDIMKKTIDFDHLNLGWLDEATGKHIEHTCAVCGKKFMGRVPVTMCNHCLDKAIDARRGKMNGGPA